MNQSEDEKRQLKILSLEDSHMDAEIIYEFLCENFGSEIQMDIVKKENEFVSAISSKKYNVILADFQLPGFDGFAALGHAKSICPTTPYICVSGFIGEEIAVELLKQGATDYVSKDKLGRLIYSIERALKESNDQEELRKTQLSVVESEERFRATFEQAAVGIFHVAIDGKIVRVNQKFCNIVGYTQDELLNMLFMDITHPDDLQNETNHLTGLLNGDVNTYSLEMRYVKKDSNIIWVNITASVINQLSAEFIYVMGIVEDISERKKAEKELVYQSGEKADRAAELIIADIELAFQSGEKADRAAELIIADIELAFQTEEKADRAAELLIANIELAFQNEEKEKRAAELLIANIELAFQNEEKDKRAAELLIANKELAFQNEKISFLSYHDYLTGLYNRAYFEEAKLRLDTPGMLPISIIMGDINGLKLINDGFGHPKGDELLVEIANILKSCGRPEDIISRIGGDEFGIILPQTDMQTAQRVCSCIYDTCKQYSLQGSSIYPSISLGYATKSSETETLDEILIAAEESMSKQKLLESRSAHSSIIGSIKVIMFEKSQETEEHAERLVQLSKSIGVAMSLTDDQINELELLSTLHDIGKMSLPAAILSKPGKLNDEEWREMKKHPEVGFRIAQATSELVPIAKYILCHHERWDGKGYPQGLIGEQIPLLSRIVAIADSFDAMTNDRAYRVAMTNREAKEEIKRCSGTQFDPEISQLFLNLVPCQILNCG